MAKAGTRFPGSATTALRRIAPARPAIPVGIAEAAMAAVVVAINTRKTRRFSAGVTYRTAFLDSFQYFPGISLELLENAAFPFASRRALKYR